MRFLTWLAVLGTAPGCVLTHALPSPTTTEQRLAQFPTQGLPLQRPVSVYWDAYQIPYIEAETDDDAAFVLGMVHAHLRLGQMEIFRRAARGRLSEMGGPFATEIDHLIRILDVDRAVPEMVRQLPQETRMWVDRFVAGINHYVGASEELPHEFSILNFEVEPWTAEDVLTIGRLASVDINWIIWLQVLNLLDEPRFESVWSRLVETQAEVQSFSPNGFVNPEILRDFSRSGSNSIVVSADRSQTGAALMANDPHLGVQQPNFWLVGAYKTPNLHAVGLMVPGVPVVALGRNQWISWGGTNMRAASSDLVDVSELAPEVIKEEEQALSVRWWFDRTITVRESPYGPIFSDVPFLDVPEGKTFALRWVGHTPSDELTSLLKVNRARNFGEFRAAFENYSVAGQNYLYADVEGNIGQVLAVRLPKRLKAPPAQPFVRPDVSDAGWSQLAGPTELPSAYNPPSGFIVSANNKPTEVDRPIGYFFAGNDRVTRLKSLVGKKDKHTLSTLHEIQRDVHMESALTLKKHFVSALKEYLASSLSDGQRRALALLETWDGHYRSVDGAPVVFEVMTHVMFSEFVTTQYSEEVARALSRSARAKAWLVQTLDVQKSGMWMPTLLRALEHGASTQLEFPTWGEMHRLSLSHPLSLAPIIGGRYRFSEQGISGSTDTIMKTAHERTDKKHTTRFGAQARHLSDMSDPNENYFVLLGGQDGWLQSENFLDQAALFTAGELIQVPLEVDAFVRKAAKLMRLTPE